MSEDFSQKRYPPELKEWAIRMVLEIIKEQNGERQATCRNGRRATQAACPI